MKVLKNRATVFGRSKMNSLRLTLIHSKERTVEWEIPEY
jgi:hypothetical protein